MSRTLPLLLAVCPCCSSSHPPAVEVADAAPACRDEDGDEHGDPTCGGDDCDDSNPAIHPGFDETAWSTETVLTGPNAGSLSAHRGIVRGVAVLQDDFIMRALSFGPGRRDAPDIDFQDLAGSLDVRTAVDDTGALHIAARNARFQDAELWYWRELDGGWRTVAGPRLADSVELGALAIGGVDGTLVRSSYSSYAFELNALEVATIGDGGWAAEIVVSESLPGAGSLEVDSGGSTHLGLIVSDPPDALYATDSSGEWAVESVLGPKEAPRPASLVLVLDAGEAPILLYAQEDGEVLQARHGSGRWELESVSHGVDVRSLAAAVDAADRLHGAFGARGGVLYFSGEPGSWATERISDVRALRVDIAAGSDGIHVLASAEAELQHLLLPAPDGVDGDCDGVVY